MFLIQARTLKQHFLGLILVIAAFSLSGCSFKRKPDPFEGVNRGIYLFNKTLDGLYVKPIATAGAKLLPGKAISALDNFYENLATLPTIANEILQLKFKEARSDMARFIINSTWGLLGFIDLATKAGLEKHQADFGQTLAFYGYKDSIYIVIPFVGPSTVRDGAGKWVDVYLGIWPYLKPSSLSWDLYAINLVRARIKFLKAEEILKEAAVDEYILVRDAYLQNRRYFLRGKDEANEDQALEGELSPLEDAIDDEDKGKSKDKSKDKDDDKDKDKDKKENDKKSDDVKDEKEKAKSDLEKKLEMTSEELEKEAEAKHKDLKQTEKDKATPDVDIKGTSTVPVEKSDKVDKGPK